MPFLGPPGAVEVGDASRKRGQEGGGPSSSRPGLPGHAVTMATDVAQGPLGAGSPRARSPGPGRSADSGHSFRRLIKKLEHTWKALVHDGVSASFIHSTPQFTNVPVPGPGGGARELRDTSPFLEPCPGGWP